MNDDEDDDSGLADFNFSSPNNASNGQFPPHPQMNYRGNINHPSSSEMKYNIEIPGKSNINSNPIPIPSNNKQSITNDNYEQQQTSYVKQYYQQYAPYFNQMSKELNDTPKGEIVEKLNYIIRILEEQQDTKTGHVLEELVLYFFLGIFVIFVVDSFARAGKYVR